jgi:SAM-dependent methyltransferase
LQADIRTVDLGQTFDAVLMMFAVLSYQITNNDVLAALRTARRHLRPKGLLVGDIWYGPAVLSIRPSDRVKVVPTLDGKIIRVASGSLDVYRQLCEVRFNVWRLKGQRVVSESEEVHRMRFFFAQELALMLELTEFQLVHLGEFPSLELAASESSWNALVVAKALPGETGLGT